VKGPDNYAPHPHEARGQMQVHREARGHVDQRESTARRTLTPA
jgi:hypothetical protein